MHNDNEQLNSLTRELELMRERYVRLVDVHGQLQKQNSLLEERVLSIVETYSNEKNQLEQDLTDAKQQIINLEDTIKELEIEKKRYKDDCNLAVRLLHRHPNEFITVKQDKNQKTSTNQPTQPQSPHNVVIPTFPPIFAAAMPLINPTIPSSTAVTSQTSTTVTTNSEDNLRLAESLFKSNSVHRYPSTHFVCANCHKTVKCCDVSVQTSIDNLNATSRIRIVSLTASDDEYNDENKWISIEPHQSHMTIQDYQVGNTRRTSQDVGLSANSVPQTHHI